jgi:hypothetical protein
MNANEGARLAGTGAEFRIKCRYFKRVEKNTLRGFVSLTVAPSGITINNVCLHQKAGRRWLSFPAKSYQDKDGKQQWWPIVEIEDREVLRRFQAAGLAAIDRYVQQGGG